MCLDHPNQAVLEAQERCLHKILQIPERGNPLSPAQGSAAYIIFHCCQIHSEGCLRQKILKRKEPTWCRMFDELLSSRLNLTARACWCAHSPPCRETDGGDELGMASEAELLWGRHLVDNSFASSDSLSAAQA